MQELQQQIGSIYPKRCTCGRTVPFSTLQYELNYLILRANLAELLDRLADLVHLQSNLEAESAVEEAWNEVGLHLERAVEAALKVATMKAEKDTPAWRL